MNKRHYFTILFALTLGSLLFAGIFEQYGLGKIGLNYSVAALGRGKSSVAYSDSLALNLQNPANLAYIHRAGIEMSIQSNHNQLAGTGNTNNYTGFSYGSLKFPLSRKGAFTLGIIPLSVSNASYRITDDQLSYNETRRSTGSIHAINLGVAYSFFPKGQLALGVSADYLIGGYTIENSIDFGSGSNLTPVQIERDEEFSGLQFSAGINIKPFKNLSMGAAYTLIGTSSQREITRYMAISPSYYYAYIDTSQISDTDIFPEQLRVGLALQLSPQYILTADWMRYQFTETASVFSINPLYEGASYKPFDHYGVGFEKRGILSEYVPFQQSLTYRFGAFYESQYLSNANGETPKTYGLSLGIGIPFSQHRNRIDAAFVLEYNRGTIYEDAGGHVLSANEFVYHFTVSISIAETWFNTRGKYR